MTDKVLKLVQQDRKLQGLYTLKTKFGNGSFGQVYECVQNSSGRHSVLKIEVAANQSQLTLKKEFNLMKRLQHISGIPKVLAFNQSLQLNFLELQRLHIDFESFFLSNHSVSADEICDIGCKTLKILKQIHKAGVVHRDIKPQNIMFDKNLNIYIIDFGISIIRGKSSPNPNNSNQQFIGTPRFASRAAHLGLDLIPKDDIESLMYVLIYATTKRLPWINAKVSNEKHNEVFIIKKRSVKKQLCQNLPKCYLATMEYIDSLQRDQDVDHNYIIKLFETERKLVQQYTSKTFMIESNFKRKQTDSELPPRHRSQQVRYSLIKHLNLPSDETLTQQDQISSGNFIIKDGLDPESGNIAEQVLSGELSLANRYGVLTPINPKPKCILE